MFRRSSRRLSLPNARTKAIHRLEDTSRQIIKKSKPIPPISNTSAPITYARPKTSFFDLPRELRDMIYHYYWHTHHRCLAAPSSPFSSLTLQLRYEGHYTMSTNYSGYDHLAHADSRYPTFLLANKQLLHEALAQFVAKAEWFWNGYPQSSTTLKPLFNVHPCVAGHPVWRDTFLSGPSASLQRDCTKSRLTRIDSAAPALTAH